MDRSSRQLDNTFLPSLSGGGGLLQLGPDRLCSATFEQLLAFGATFSKFSNFEQLLVFLAAFEQLCIDISNKNHEN